MWRIALGKWERSADDEWIKVRVYWGHRWTPFIRRYKRYPRVDLALKIEDLNSISDKHHKQMIKTSESVIAADCKLAELERRISELTDMVRLTKIRLDADEKQIDNIGNATLATDRKLIGLLEKYEELHAIFHGKTVIAGDVHMFGKHNTSTVMIIASHLGPNQGFVKVIPMNIENYGQLVQWCKMVAEAYGVDTHNDLYLDLGPGAGRHWRKDSGL